MTPILKPSFNALFDMQPPQKWSVNTAVEMNYVRIYSDFELLYEYRFQDAQEAERKAQQLWRNWKQS